MILIFTYVVMMKLMINIYFVLFDGLMVFEIFNEKNLLNI